MTQQQSRLADLVDLADYTTNVAEQALPRLAAELLRDMEGMRQQIEQRSACNSAARRAVDDRYWLRWLENELDRAVNGEIIHSRLRQIRQNYDAERDHREIHLEFEPRPAQSAEDRPRSHWLALHIPAECQFEFTQELVATIWDRVRHERRRNAMLTQQQAQQRVELQIACGTERLAYGSLAIRPELMGALFDLFAYEGRFEQTYGDHIAAEAKSLELLAEELSPAQLAEWQQSASFTVTGCVSDKRYRIERGTSMNVKEIGQNDREIAWLCFQPAGASSTGDTMLAQKLALELFEPEALRVANRSPVGGALCAEPAQAACEVVDLFYGLLSLSTGDRS